MSEAGHTGPYDVITLIKKIRNRSLGKYDKLLCVNTQETKEAIEWNEIKDFFIELDNKKDETETMQTYKSIRYDLFEALKYGFMFLYNNIISMLFSGLFILLILLITLAIAYLSPVNLRGIFSALGLIFLYLFYSC
ncbi:MAG: hypothetical protein WCJ33_10275, partial [Pseudomonadota bacterium]